MWALTMNAPLLDDIEVLHHTVIRGNDAIAFGIEAQLTVLHQKGQVGRLHLVERGVLAQEFHGAVDILQYGRLPSLRKGVGCAHAWRPFFVNGVLRAVRTQLDVSLVSAGVAGADQGQADVSGCCDSAA
jgi:hypothetical protein